MYFADTAVSCGDTSTSYMTQFSSSGNLFGYGRQRVCSIRVQRLSDNICQLYLKFVSFVIQQPNSEGHCITDQLVISQSAHDENLPKLCGLNSGQHCKYY